MSVHPVFGASFSTCSCSRFLNGATFPSWMLLKNGAISPFASSGTLGEELRLLLRSNGVAVGIAFHQVVSSGISICRVGGITVFDCQGLSCQFCGNYSATGVSRENPEPKDAPGITILLCQHSWAVQNGKEFLSAGE